MSKYRVLKGGVWRHYKPGDIVDTDKSMDFYVAEGVLEELAVPLQVDTERCGGVPVQLRVTDVQHEISTTQR